MPHPSQPATAEPASSPADPTADSPPAKKPRDNPNLHGRSTGPRTAGDREDLQAAPTIHGRQAAEARAEKRYRLTMLRRNHVTPGAIRYMHHMSPVFVARLYGYAPELLQPPSPTGGITAAAGPMRRRAVAAALAPWKQAIATAREAGRAARAASLRVPDTSRQTSRSKNPRINPMIPRRRPSTLPPKPHDSNHPVLIP